MTLEFLTPSHVAAAPAARSPIAELAGSDGALLDTREGWDVVVSFGAPEDESRACVETAGVADLSHLTRIEAVLPTPGHAATGIATYVQGWWVCPVRRDLQLIVRSAAEGDGLEAPAPDEARLTDLTSSLCAIAVVGPAAPEVFARVCALDLRDSTTPVAGFRPGSIARTPGYLLREGREWFTAMAGAAYAAYLWETFLDAAGTLGGGAVGLDALPRLEAEDA